MSMIFGSFWKKWAKPKDKAEVQYLVDVAMSSSVSIRSNLARELGMYIADGSVARIEKESLQPVFEILTADKSDHVQVALAKAICQSKHVVPRGIIFKLAAVGCEKASSILFEQSPLISEGCEWFFARRHQRTMIARCLITCPFCVRIT